MKMKFTPTTMKSLAVLALGSLSAAAQEAPDPSIHGDPYIPVGKLQVNPIFVQTGVKPNLDWGIEYPTLFADLAVIAPTGSLVTTEEVTTEIRVDGICNDCDVESQSQSQPEVALWVNIDGNWSLLYKGNRDALNPTKVLFRKKVPAGTQIDVAARAQSSSGSWYPLVWTMEDSPKLVHLGNKDTVPDFIIPKFSTQELKSYTTAVLSDDNLVAEIGPKDLVYMFELQSEDPSDPCFDLQDMQVSIQMLTKNNNGHGNNIDGVDSSNPAVEDGITQSGAEDSEVPNSSGNVDDEMKEGDAVLIIK